MKRNGTYALDFQAPALVGTQLTYLRGRQFMGHLVVLCFLPHAGPLQMDAIDRYAGRFLGIGVTLLIVSPDGRSLHRLWIDQSQKSSIAVLADPCGRLHRLFGVTGASLSSRCRSFVIDGEGVLRLCVSHNFIDGD